MRPRRTRLKIDPERRRGALHPRIYGQFMRRRPGGAEGGLHDPDAPGTDAFGMRQDAEAFIRALAPPIVRWPGGCTGTDYPWRDGVGPVADRPSTIDLHPDNPRRELPAHAHAVAHPSRDAEVQRAQGVQSNRLYLGYRHWPHSGRNRGYGAYSPFLLRASSGS